MYIYKLKLVLFIPFNVLYSGNGEEMQRIAIKEVSSSDQSERLYHEHGFKNEVDAFTLPQILPS